MSEILHVITFDTICTSSFDTKCVHRTMETPCLFHFPQEFTNFLGNTKLSFLKCVSKTYFISFSLFIISFLDLPSLSIVFASFACVS
jgi:hypothetical protein